jgi:hypothetical protein
LELFESSGGLCVHQHTPQQHQDICKACWTKTMNAVAKMNVYGRKVKTRYFKSYAGGEINERLERVKRHRAKHGEWATLPKSLLAHSEAAGLHVNHGEDWPGFSRCPFSDDTDYCALAHCQYETVIDGLTEDWRTHDNQVKLAESDLELKQMHDLCEPPRIKRGRRGTVSEEINAEHRPLYEVVRTGVSPMTNAPFAEVRLTGLTTVHLHVDLPTPSKNARRKLKRYGRMPVDLLTAACNKAVGDWYMTTAH